MKSLSPVVDDAIAALWDVCSEWGEAEAFCDQWWLASAECSHGLWSAESDGWLDLSVAWERLAEVVRDGHAVGTHRHELDESRLPWRVCVTCSSTLRSHATE